MSKYKCINHIENHTNRYYVGDDVTITSTKATGTGTIYDITSRGVYLSTGKKYPDYFAACDIEIIIKLPMITQ